MPEPVCCRIKKWSFTFWSQYYLWISIFSLHYHIKLFCSYLQRWNSQDIREEVEMIHQDMFLLHGKLWPWSWFIYNCRHYFAKLFSWKRPFYSTVPARLSTASHKLTLIKKTLHTTSIAALSISCSYISISSVGWGCKYAPDVILVFQVYSNIRSMNHSRISFFGIIKCTRNVLILCSFLCCNRSGFYWPDLFFYLHCELM